MNLPDPYQSVSIESNLADNVYSEKEHNDDKVYLEFEETRAYWLNRIKELSKMFTDVNKLINLQVQLYSDRQVLLEYMHKLLRIVAKTSSKIKKAKKDLFDHYTQSEDYRYTTNEKNSMIELDLREVLERMEHFDNQIDYCKESLKTYDSMIFGVKHRLSIEEVRTR